MSGGFVALFLVALVMVTFWLSLYVYGLLALGRWLASRWRTKMGKWSATAIFAGASLVADLPLLPLQLEAVFKLTLLFAVWLIHTHATSLGYWIAFEALRKGDEDRWAKTADRWVSEFEEAAPSFMRELDDRG